jgi:hypothetical protein
VRLSAKRGESYAADEDDCPNGIRPSVIHRAAVLFETPHCSAAARTDKPAAATGAACRRGRPSRVPWAFARARPALTRAAMLNPGRATRARASTVFIHPFF